MRDRRAFMPAIVLGVGVLGVLVEAFVPRSVRRTTQLVLTFLALVGALLTGAALWQDTLSTGGVSLFGGSYILDGPALALQLTLVVLTILAVAVFADRTSQGQDAFAPTASAIPGSDYEELARREGLEQTEVYPLALFGLGGMLLFVSAGDLLSLFVALEVLSLPLYILTGLARRRRLLSQEASLKYMLLGAYASAFFLFGAALLYGFAGSVKLADIAASTGEVVGLDGLLLAGTMLVLLVGGEVNSELHKGTGSIRERAGQLYGGRVASGRVPGGTSLRPAAAQITTQNGKVIQRGGFGFHGGGGS